MLSGFDIISLQVLAAEISFSYINNICKKKKALPVIFSVYTYQTVRRFFRHMYM